MPEKILVIDDDVDHSRIVQIGLEMEDYQVVLAHSGREGLELAASEKPDLLVLDVIMPDMDGFQVLELLKENEATSAIPVVMLTARDEATDSAICDRLGAVLYFPKPFQPRVFAAFVRQILQPQSSEPV